MTKEEVLRGAFALNGEDKKYTITVEGDQIITEASYDCCYGKATFRSVACLNDDNTYVEIHKNQNRREVQYGRVSTVQKTITIGFNKESGKVEVEQDQFNSEECKKIIRDYLESCGYKRTNKGFWKRLFGK